LRSLENCECFARRRGLSKRYHIFSHRPRPSFVWNRPEAGKTAWLADSDLHGGETDEEAMVDIDARNRAKKIAVARGMGAVANDTKWREFFGKMIAENVRVDIKLLYEELPFHCGRVRCPSTNYIEGSGGMGPELFIFIEWIQSAEATLVHDTAVAIGRECDVKDGVATVYGYR
jgi:hypothetical protein